MSSIEEQPSMQETSPKQKNEHPRIVFGNETVGKKQSALERLGKRPNQSALEAPTQKRTKISLSNTRKEEEEILGISKSNNEQSAKTIALRVDRDDKHKKDEIENRRNVVSKHGDTPAPREVSDFFCNLGNVLISLVH